MEFSNPGYKSAVARWFHLDTLDPERFVTSYFVSPFVLRTLRTFIAVYVTATLIYSIVYNDIVGELSTFLDYFTYLTYIGLWGYFMNSVVHSYLYSIRGDVSSFMDYPILTAMHYALYHTVIVFNFLVPIVFWALLSGTLLRGNAGPAEWYNNINVHVLGLVWMFVDVILTRQRCDWRMFVIVFIIVLLYTFEAWIIHAVDGFWTYSFFSWDVGPIAAVWYIGVTIVVIIIFAIQRYIIHPLRDRIGQNVLQPTQAFSNDETKNATEGSEMA